MLPRLPGTPFWKKPREINIENYSILACNKRGSCNFKTEQHSLFLILRRPALLLNFVFCLYTSDEPMQGVLHSLQLLRQVLGQFTLKHDMRHEQSFLSSVGAAPGTPSQPPSCCDGLFWHTASHSRRASGHDCEGWHSNRGSGCKRSCSPWQAVSSTQGCPIAEELPLLSFLISNKTF